MQIKHLPLFCFYNYPAGKVFSNNYKAAVLLFRLLQALKSR
jgi:hypothetical protein